MSVVHTHPSNTTSQRVVDPRSRIRAAKRTVYTASPMCSDGKQFKGLSYAWRTRNMKSVTTTEGRGPWTGSSRKHTNPTLDTATNPAACRLRSDRVHAIQGSAINSRYTDWYAQIHRGLKPIARSSDDSGTVRGLNSRKRCNV